MLQAARSCAWVMLASPDRQPKRSSPPGWPSPGKLREVLGDTRGDTRAIPTN